MHRVLFKIGNFDIYTYGVMLVTGFLIGIGFAILRNRSKTIKNDDILDMSFYLLLGGVIGARLIYVVLHGKDYLGSPFSIINLREGGLAWHGGLLGGFLACVLFSRKRKLNPFEFLDLYAPSIMLALAVGRIGCFLNGCCVGTETISPLGVVFHDAGYHLARHPTQIYEMVMDLVLVGILLAWEKHKKFTGELFLMVFPLYSVVRFITEIFRESPPRIMGLSIAQYSSIVIIVVTTIWIYYERKKAAPDEGRKKRQ